jgi:hypothetical protein
VREPWPSRSARMTAGRRSRAMEADCQRRGDEDRGPPPGGRAPASRGADPPRHRRTATRRRRRHGRCARRVVDRHLSCEVARLQPRDLHDPEAPHRLEDRSAATGGVDARQDRGLPPGEGRHLLAADARPPPRLSWPRVQRRSQAGALPRIEPGHGREEAESPQEGA